MLIDIGVNLGERNAMRITGIFLGSAVLVAVAWLGFAGSPEVLAGGGPGKIIFKNTKSFAPVVFDHAKHKEAGTACGDCHDSLFQKKAGSTDTDNALTMKALRQGKFCGTCHNGKQAFTARRNCKKCHQK